MIATPGDVANERQVARDVIQEWNFIHSEDRSLVLMPVGWDTHAQPEMGDRPQALINKQVLKGCDLLVAVFWTRLGSPTGVETSGTVEEIEEHLRAGKRAMVYFSRVPVRPDSVDDAQYKSLVQFRQDCERRGLIEAYDSVQEFRNKFARQLAQTVIDMRGNDGEEDAIEFERAQRERGSDPIVASLSKDTRELLLAGSEDQSGTILRLRTMAGLVLSTNGRQFGEHGDPRSEAKWEAAIDTLRELRLIQDLGHKSEVFRLTELGYQTADRLRGGVGVA
jgi:hypothetical protein